MTEICRGDKQKNCHENTEFLPTTFLKVTYNQSEYSADKNVLFKDTRTNQNNAAAIKKGVDSSMLENNYPEENLDNGSQKRSRRLATFQSSEQSVINKGKKNKMPPSADSGHFSCMFCDKYFIHKNLLKRHMKLHMPISEKINQTQMQDNNPDNNNFSEKEVVNAHNTSYVCDICGMDCRFKSVLLQHKRTHKKEEKKTLSCHICSKQFKFLSLLTHHLDSHNTKNKAKKSLTCQICGKNYTKEGSLNKHQLQHEGRGTFRCRPCGKVFATEIERAKHRDKEHEKPWKCQACSHLFATEEKLKVHMKWHESKETEVFICNVCGKEFKLKVNLKVHVESRCGTDPQHVCKVCGKAFMTRGTLVTHALLHTGEKTFLCRFCGKNFRLKVEMQRHERSHTGEKPFVCKTCGKAFAHRESLVTHNTLHTGIRPYMCEACGCTFSCIGNLIKHRKTHRNKCALNTPSVTNKSKTKSKANQLTTQNKNNLGNRKPPVERSNLVTSRPTVEIQKGSNTVPPDLMPSVGLPANYCDYRNTSFEENQDWITPAIGSNDLSTVQTSAIDRFHPVGDCHFTSMEQNIKSSQFYWGNSNFNVHPDAMPTFGIHTEVPRESKSDDSARYLPFEDRGFSRCLPYPCTSDSLLALTEKPSVGSIFQNYDTQKIPSYAREKLSQEHRISNGEHDRFLYNHKIIPDISLHAGGHFKLLNSVPQNDLSVQKQGSCEINSSCGNLLSQSAVFNSTVKRSSICDEVVSGNNGIFVPPSFMGNEVTNSLRSEEFVEKQNTGVSESLSNRQQPETGDISNLDSPLNSSSDNDFLEPEEPEANSTTSLLCKETEKMKDEADDKCLQNSGHLHHSTDPRFNSSNKNGIASLNSNFENQKKSDYDSSNSGIEPLSKNDNYSTISKLESHQENNINSSIGSNFEHEKKKDLNPSVASEHCFSAKSESPKKMHIVQISNLNSSVDSNFESEKKTFLKPAVEHCSSFKSESPKKIYNEQKSNLNSSVDSNFEFEMNKDLHPSLDSEYSSSSRIDVLKKIFNEQKHDINSSGDPLFESEKKTYRNPSVESDHCSSSTTDSSKILHNEKESNFNSSGDSKFDSEKKKDLNPSVDSEHDYIFKSESSKKIHKKQTSNYNTPVEYGDSCNSKAKSSKKICIKRKSNVNCKVDYAYILNSKNKLKKKVLSPNIIFPCASCRMEFTEASLLEEHMKSHSLPKENELNIRNKERDEDLSDDKTLDLVPKKFFCKYCNSGFELISHLNHHMRSHSADMKARAPCCYCGKMYTNRKCLIKHESQHSANGVFKCRSCDEGFDSKQEYRSHRMKQHGKQWNCSECQRPFSNASNLRNHFNNKHLDQEAKSYACNICGKTFKQKGNLKVHVDSHCGSEPRHVCKICGKAFMSGGSLGTHLLLHTGEKTFLCRFCGKNFRLKVEMQRHERSHTGEKPFVCKVCNKAFAHRESLVTHNTLHTGIRPYMCESCGQTFSCIGNLIKHRHTHNRRCDV